MPEPIQKPPRELLFVSKRNIPDAIPGGILHGPTSTPQIVVHAGNPVHTLHSNHGTRRIYRSRLSGWETCDDASDTVATSVFSVLSTDVVGQDTATVQTVERFATALASDAGCKDSFARVIKAFLPVISTPLNIDGVDTGSCASVIIIG